MAPLLPCDFGDFEKMSIILGCYIVDIYMIHKVFTSVILLVHNHSSFIMSKKVSQFCYVIP